jgi:hypothetical protein
MCPMCLAATGAYVAGGVSAGAVTTVLATRLLRKRSESTDRHIPIESEGDDHATTDDRIEG